ncbi:MAG: hypothetical protein HUU54_12530 [Ignavibacteriaceae bacterium]|nr:hypothetical protein [Ignavibacteriaceae bacterium]
MNIQAESNFQNFQHSGEYVGIIGNLKRYYQDAEGKLKGKDGVHYTESTPGVKLGFMQLQIFFVRRPDGSPLIMQSNGEYIVVPGTDYGEIVYSQYIDIAPEKQFANRSLFLEFVTKVGNEEVAVVTGDERDFKVNLGVLPHFLGMQVKVLFEKSAKGNSLVKRITLIDNTYDLAKYMARKVLVESLEKVAENYLNS